MGNCASRDTSPRLVMVFRLFEEAGWKTARVLQTPSDFSSSKTLVRLRATSPHKYAACHKKNLPNHDIPRRHNHKFNYSSLTPEAMEELR
jgi:hypothetical protein